MQADCCVVVVQDMAQCALEVSREMGWSKSKLLPVLEAPATPAPEVDVATREKQKAALDAAFECGALSAELCTLAKAELA